MKLWYNAFPVAYGYPSEERINKGDNGVLIDSNRIFNWDAMPQRQTEAQQRFLAGLDENHWEPIPREIADYTNWQNFYEFVKVPRNPNTKYEDFYQALRSGEEM